MSIRKKQQEATRRAILSALGELVAESGTMGFTIQDVARRAGVTHRTVYNHFPTREDLSHAFGAHVEDELQGQAVPPDADLRITELPSLIRNLYPILQTFEAHCRAYVMLMIAARAPAPVMSDRSRHFEEKVQAEWGPMAPAQARRITAALRLFASTAGWHLLTEHHQLSGEDARHTAAWATRVLLEAIARGDHPTLETPDESDHGR